MVINISVQYSGGLLPDIILLTILPVGNPFKAVVNRKYPRIPVFLYFR